MIKNLNILLALILLTLIGGFFRFYHNTTNPVSLGIDEVSFGYNAYSILKTGKDEYGVSYPITFKSVGDYKNPVPIYITVPSVALFGLNEFSVRFPSGLIATIGIPIFYLLVFYLTKNQKLSLLGAGMFAISPWHLFYSRMGSDHQIAMVFLMIGLVFFLRMLEGGLINSLISALFFTLSMYTYYPERPFVPMLFVLLSGIYYQKLRKNFKTSLIFFTTFVILVTPLAYRSFFGEDLARGKMVFIKNDIDFTRYVVLEDKGSSFSIGGIKIDQTIALIFFSLKRYLNYFEPDFWFFNGLNMTQESSLGLGVVYLFELPFLILGIYYLFKDKFKHKWLILGWIGLSIIPAVLTNNEHNAGRTIIAMPMVLVISAIGFYYFIQLINHKKTLFKSVILTGFIGFVILTLIQAGLVFAVHYPIDHGEDSMEGTKLSVLYALQNYDKYQQIVFDPIRGVIAPTTFNLPQYYILFYSLYDPTKYQTENKNKDETFGFDKYQIRKIYWPDDRYKIGTLFIGSPWSIPEKELKPGELLKKIYLTNGELALLIVSPKP